MENKKHVIWIIVYFFIVGVMLTCAGFLTYKVDPFMHYRYPDTDKYLYQLNNQRSQNDGICKYFDYTGMITGTSMTECFKTTEAENLFGGTFIKVPYSGASYKEINDVIKKALTYQENLQVVIRGLDMKMFFYDKDQMRLDLGEYPTYLYDDNVFNDVKYVFNRDVFFSRTYPMIKDGKNENIKKGITSFDTYSNWMSRSTFGKNTLYPDGVFVKGPTDSIQITQEEREKILGNIHQNVTDIADEYPDVTFYCFFTPYSIKWWHEITEDGTFEKQFEAERIIIEELLKHENIKLYSFNGLTDITTDLNNYKDECHYGEWINSMILRYMYDGKCLLTKDNYQQYLEKEYKFYSTFDFEQLKCQEDYENDYYAAALINREVTGAEPLNLDLSDDKKVIVSNAEVVDDQYEGHKGILCTGNLQRQPEDEITVGDYIRDNEYSGFAYTVDDITSYRYLVFYGKKIKDHGQVGVYIYDENGQVTREYAKCFTDLDGEWHQYMIDLKGLTGPATIIFHGGYVDVSGNTDSQFVFSDVTLY